LQTCKFPANLLYASTVALFNGFSPFTNDCQNVNNVWKLATGKGFKAEKYFYGYLVV